MGDKKESDMDKPMPGDVSPNMSHDDMPDHEPDEDEMACQNCGYELDAGDDVCPECGMPPDKTDMDAKPPMPDMPQHEKVLSYGARKNMDNSKFAYIAPSGKRMFPIPDAAHVRNALARLPNAKLSADIKARIKKKLVAAAKKFGIKVSEANALINGNLLIEQETAPLIIEEGYDDGYHRVKILVTTVGEKNRNGRIYTMELAEREAAKKPDGSILGQSNHPYDAPDLLNQFLNFEKFSLDGIHEYAVAKVIPTSKGRDFIEIAKAGVQVSASRRGAGTVKEGMVNGVRGLVVQNDYKLFGIDVLYPGVQSDPNARMVTFESTETENEPMPESEPITEQAPVAEQAAPPAPTPVAPEPPPVPSDVVERLTSEIQAKDTLLAKQNVKLSELAEAFATLTEQVKAMTLTFPALNDEILRLEKRISELNGEVADRAKVIAERDEMVRERNEEIAKRQKLLVEAYQTVSERDAAIAERNHIIMERNSMNALRDETVAKRDQELAARNEEIIKQDRVIAERDAAIAERDRTLAELRAELSKRDETIAEGDRQVIERSQQLLEATEKLGAEKALREAEIARNQAFQHLFEKVQIQGEKAAWLIFNDLKGCQTVTEVDEQFQAAKERNLRLIEGVAKPAGKAVLVETAPTDADDPNLKDQQKKNEQDKDKQKRDEVAYDVAKKYRVI